MERQVARAMLFDHPVITVELTNGRTEHRIVAPDTGTTMIVGTDIGNNSGVSYRCVRCGGFFEVDKTTPVAVSNQNFKTHLAANHS